MYDVEYAEAWLKHAESGKDFFRHKYLYPYFKEVLGKLPAGSRVLDVGCGWGEALGSVPEHCRYVGVDPTPRFLDYIRTKHHQRKKILRVGSLPSAIPGEHSFDAVLCSMVLHCVPELEESVETLFSKAKKGGKVVIVDFNDRGESLVRSTFARVDESRDNYVGGLYQLSEDVQVRAEAYFHKEKQIEREIRKHDGFKKTFLGPIFVGYEARKR